ncbi:MAG: hypothetical protein NTW21_03910 [Verrucomicrobia bacterium]|nr:hypothetical protein [Verrucomicrobiota bacterium]
MSRGFNPGDTTSSIPSMSGGILGTTGEFIVGASGGGTLNQSGGTINVGKDARSGQYDSQGAMPITRNLTGPGTVAITGNLRIGYNQGQWLTGDTLGAGAIAARTWPIQPGGKHTIRVINIDQHIDVYPDDRYVMNAAGFMLETDGLALTSVVGEANSVTSRIGVHEKHVQAAAGGGQGGRNQARRENAERSPRPMSILNDLLVKSNQ